MTERRSSSSTEMNTQPEACASGTGRQEKLLSTPGEALRGPKGVVKYKKRNIPST